MQFLIASIWLFPLLLLIFAKRIGTAHVVVHDNLLKGNLGYDTAVRKSVRTERLYILLYTASSGVLFLMVELAIAWQGFTDQSRFVPLIIVVVVGFMYVARSSFLISDYHKIIARRKEKIRS